MLVSTSKSDADVAHLAALTQVGQNQVVYVDCEPVRRIIYLTSCPATTLEDDLLGSSLVDRGSAAAIRS